MKRLLIILFSLVCMSAEAQIQVQIEPTQVVEGESFQLTLSQENSQQMTVPNLTVLQRDFTVLGTERNLSYSVINGQAQSVSQWVITLRAKKSGIVTIPSISFGKEKSDPLTINIAASNTPKIRRAVSNQNQDEDFFIEALVNENQPFVNQQVIYTVKIFNRKRLLNADYQGPSAEDLLLIPFSDGKRYQTTRNNREYIVEEQTYALFPQKSGTLTIQSPVISAMVYDINPQRIKVQDSPLQLKVRSIPKAYKAKNWLPAQQINLSEQYENSSQVMSQGSTLVRTVTIEGVAVPGQLLPSLPFTEDKAFNVYPEKGREQNLVKQGVIVGSVSIKVTYLFKEPGRITLPAITVPWFNTITGQEETAVLPPRSIEITPSATAAPSQQEQPPIIQNTTKPDNQSIMAPVSSPNGYGPWMAALFFAFLWLSTLFLWIIQRRKKYWGGNGYKKALNQVKAACAKGDITKTRDALLKWANLHWPDLRVLNLNELSDLIQDGAFKKQIQRLSQALYHKEHKQVWQGNELLTCLLAFTKTKSSRQPTKKENLPPMYKI